MTDHTGDRSAGWSDKPTARELLLRQVNSAEYGETRGWIALLALEAAVELCDPLELGSGVPRARIRALIDEVRNA